MKEKLFQKILVPVDGSTPSLKALKMAACVAQAHNSELIILHVLDVATLSELVKFWDKSHEDIKEKMKEKGRGLLHSMEKEVPDVPATTLLKEGSPHEIILNVASEYNVDLIIMGRLGKKGARRILIGSVTERVIEFSKVPVLVIT